MLLASGSAWAQHVIWLLGYPETWLYVAMWIVILAGTFSLSRYLLRKFGTLAAALFVVAFAVFVGGYFWLAIRVRSALVEGDLSLASHMSTANSALIAAALASSVWLMLRRRRAG